MNDNAALDRYDVDEKANEDSKKEDEIERSSLE